MEKKILVIDDKGDVSKSLSDLFADDSKIKITYTKSDTDNLNENFDRLAYLIIVNEDGLENNLNNIIQFIHRNMFYLTIPVIILSSNDELVQNKDIMEIPIYNYINKPVDSVKFKEFLQYFIEVCDYNKNINDLSGLPGNRIIDRVLADEISKESKFSMIYADLDNFKEFNEYHGVYTGSECIVSFSKLLDNVIKTYGADDDFIGHIGGDDFILVIKDHNNAKKICDEIIKEFDKLIVNYYSKEDLKKGYIEVRNRAGEMDKINIMGVSIIHLDYTDFIGSSYDEVYKELMKLKRQAKMIKGSVVL